MSSGYGGVGQPPDPNQPKNTVRRSDYVEARKVVWLGLVALLVFGLIAVGGMAGCREYKRFQKRADAKNEIRVAGFNAQTVRAQIEATKARAEKRVAEARGIKTSQELIAGSLTPLYVQHEAIQAQKVGGAGDRTYIPVGPQGVPLVANVNDPSLENPEGEK